MLYIILDGYPQHAKPVDKYYGQAGPVFQYHHFTLSLMDNKVDYGYNIHMFQEIYLIPTTRSHRPINMRFESTLAFLLARHLKRYHA